MAVYFPYLELRDQRRFPGLCDLAGVTGSTLSTLGSASIAGAVIGGNWDIKGKSGANLPVWFADFLLWLP